MGIDCHVLAPYRHSNFREVPVEVRHRRVLKLLRSASSAVSSHGEASFAASSSSTL